MTSSYISFSQTTNSVENTTNNIVQDTQTPIVEDITPDKVVKDSITGKTYWIWETGKAKEIAKCLEKGLIDAEKVDALSTKIIIMEEKDKQCKNITDSLILENAKANEIIKNDEQILSNDKKTIAKYEEISTKKDEIIQKQEGKIKRKNGTVKTLIGTNVVTLAIVLFFILL